MRADELDCRARLTLFARAVMSDLRLLGITEDRMANKTLPELVAMKERALVALTRPAGRGGAIS